VKKETGPVSETLRSLVYDDEQSPKIPVILSVLRHRQNVLESTCSKMAARFLLVSGLKCFSIDPEGGFDELLRIVS
jgi:hypothetical protein